MTVLKVEMHPEDGDGGEWITLAELKPGDGIKGVELTDPPGRIMFSNTGEQSIVMFVPMPALGGAAMRQQLAVVSVGKAFETTGAFAHGGRFRIRWTQTGGQEDGSSKD